MLRSIPPARIEVAKAVLLSSWKATLSRREAELDSSKRISNDAERGVGTESVYS